MKRELCRGEPASSYLQRHREFLERMERAGADPIQAPDSPPLDLRARDILPFDRRDDKG